ncbi:hypothetical protein L1049_026313 [Liquidambar formosana]|uniref:Uncharacterized protein n=1 Tax=Liquidambar formosana TaxID=63359 RepID=A0AAP0ND04_LIQFO
MGFVLLLWASCVTRLNLEGGTLLVVGHVLEAVFYFEASDDGGSNLVTKISNLTHAVLLLAKSFSKSREETLRAVTSEAPQKVW